MTNKSNNTIRNRLVTHRIRQLNDQFRQKLSRELGFVQLSNVIKILPDPDRVGILSRVMYFRDFDPAMDTAGEHRCGRFTYKDHQVMFRIDYWDPTLTVNSREPGNVDKTIRVLNIRLVEEGGP